MLICGKPKLFMPSRIAICLYDESIDSFDTSSLLGGQPLKKITLHKADKDVALFLKRSNEITPEWVNILQKFSDIDIAETITASSGAILFLKISGKIIACCFGSSVANINRNNIVADFGLAVAYRRIPKRNYKGIETYTLTENPITNSRSSAMPSSQNTFNLDSYLETITELSGKYYSNTKNVLIKGKEFFSIPAPMTLGEIKKLCKDLIDDYQTSIKDPEFKKLTAVTKVKDKKLIEFLNDKLCELLNKRSNTVHLIQYECYRKQERFNR